MSVLPHPALFSHSAEYLTNILEQSPVNSLTARYVTYRLLASVIWFILSFHRYPSVGLPFVCFGGSRSGVSSMERGRPTPGYVKLLLPPRQSRGNSHVGLAHPPRPEAAVMDGGVSVTADQAHAIPDVMSPACSWLRVRPGRDREGNFRPRGIASLETAARVGARQE